MTFSRRQITACAMVAFGIFSARVLPLRHLTSQIHRLKHFRLADRQSPFPSCHEGIFTSVSFFKFLRVGLAEPHVLRSQIEDKLVEFNSHGIHVVGTLLIAEEGINGQFAIRSNVLNEVFSTFRNLHPIFDDVEFNIGETTDYSISEKKQFPFKKLIVKVKPAILTDNIPQECRLDFTDAGPELDGQQWHAAIRQTIDNNSNLPAPNTRIIDCRNMYESERGTFVGAVPLKTEKFSESWPMLDSMLAETPKDTRIMTFCTGGIRCVKVNAYLKQRLGFENVYRLKDGIIGYERWLKHEGPGQGECQEQEQGEEQSTEVRDFDFDERPSVAVAVRVDTPAASPDGESQSMESSSALTKSSVEADIDSKPKSLFWGDNFVFDRRRL